MQELSAHQRLYGSIRRRLLVEHSPFAGRLAPLQIADDNRVSVTPVREALFRLAGERLVDLHADGGFSEVRLDATSLADLHAWNGHHLLAALHMLPDGIVAAVIAATPDLAPAAHADVVERVETLFASIGRATGNQEFAVQMDSANARLRRARLSEDRLFPDTSRELRSMVRRVAFDAKANVRRRILAYHRRRVEHAGQIAALLRRG